MMKRLANILLLGLWLSVLALPAAAAPLEQKSAPTPVPADTADIRKLMSKMTAADKVGQLFLVSFVGSNVGEDSDIAALVRDYRVGGVMLLPENDNYRNPVAGPAGPDGQSDSTPDQILRLSNQLQTLAMSPARPITSTQPVTATATESAPAFNAPRSPTPRGTPPAPTPIATPRPTATTPVSPSDAGDGSQIPLLVGIDWGGDGGSTFAGTNGFTALPSQMAMGATWTPELAQKTGQVLGQELKAVGVNLVLGPSLDVLDSPRPGSRGDLRTRAFGGDPFWVGQMGQAFIRGVQEGSGNGVMTAAKHFPGQGAADRRPEDEVATVQKSLQQLRQIEISPFVAVTGGDLDAPGVTAGLMTSHIRYRGFQGNIRQLTPPISLAPQLGDLMALKEFADWRAAGGILVSDALGVPALRRYYDPQLQKFPYRQVAQDAFLAGNDLLYLSRFALTDNWPDQYQAIRETILFFRSKYQDDAEFRARVDASVERILKMKRRIYGGNWTSATVLADPALLHGRVGQDLAVTSAVARAAATLIYPGREELADRLPSAPLADDNILVFTDGRQVRDCAACPATALIAPTALQDIILRLYGPSATGQVIPGHVRSLTFDDLERLMAAPPGSEQEIEAAIAAAQWIVFAELDHNAEDFPASNALRAFLAKRSDSLRDKRLVVLAFDAPYYLDTTEISKLTAYFGLYASSAPFLETAVRALFREFSPVGAPPVSVSGINYDLISQLEPAPGQVIGLSPAGPEGLADSVASIQVGSKIQLATGIISDRNGHPVPDGTPVEFHLRYPIEGLQLAPLVETTSGGRARTTVSLDRVGELWVTVQAGTARESARIVLKIGGDTPGSIATVLPSPTALVSPTPMPTPTRTLTPEPSPTATTTATPASPPPPPPKPRVGLGAFLFALIGVLLSSGSAFALRDRPGNGRGPALARGVAGALWAAVTAWAAYLLYSFGLLPGATQVQAAGQAWVAGVVTLIGGWISLLWSAGEAGAAVRRWLS